MNILALTPAQVQSATTLALSILASIGTVLGSAVLLWAKYGPIIVGLIAEFRAGIAHGAQASANNAAAITANAQTIAQVATAVPTVPAPTAKEIVGELLQQVNIAPTVQTAPAQTEAKPL